ncbi:hypothetical protein IFT48_01075 [Pseudomonas fluorescens]|uniref:hypothetical protein n=1 Tax=Pseudomonas TaxID=286 RepID=UPI000F021B7A|nr:MULTISPECIES: hypothetical protein [Pseudomonas]MBD8088585.1 hypothetical protein [Pseudomonas fluorescens]MBD8614954.1 hypothetical protein [Pseudomonas putida]MBD8681363.1 hypothetical protein [Pseudomonas sp. CFBP 13719]
MTMITPRNQLPATLMPTDTDMLDEIDAVYEILDAELPSELNVHRQAIAILKSEPKPVEALTRLFLSHVDDVSKRDGLMLGVPKENHQAIATRLATDWDNSYGVDIRRAKLQEMESPSP